jgi:hypothetical protein
MITVERLKFIKIRRKDEISACLNLNEAMTGAVAKKRNRIQDKHDRRVFLRITRRFTSGYLSIEYLIGRKQHDINLD